MSTNYTKEQLEAYTNKELKTILEDKYGISGKYPTARVPHAPNKSELITLIDELQKNNGDIVTIIEKYSKPSEPDIEITTGKPQPKKKLTREQKIAQKRKELNALVRCIVTKKYSNQTFEKGSKVIEFVTWGNNAIGIKTTRIVYDEVMLYPKGALQNLEQVMATITKVDEKGNLYTKQVKAYHIEYLPQITEEELREIAERQKYYENN